jgi:hypothetical protein
LDLTGDDVGFDLLQVSLDVFGDDRFKFVKRRKSDFTRF